MSANYIMNAETIKQLIDSVRDGSKDTLEIKAREWSCCHSTTLDKRSQCSGCRAIYYCSAACQKSDWPSHKPNCGKNKDNQALRNSLGEYLRMLPGKLVLSFNKNITAVILRISNTKRFLNRKDTVLSISSDMGKNLPYTMKSFSNFDSFVAEYNRSIRPDQVSNMILDMYTIVNEGRYLFVMISDDIGFCRATELDK